MSLVHPKDPLRPTRIIVSSASRAELCAAPLNRVLRRPRMFR